MHTQSIKSNKVKGPSFIHTLVSDHSKYTKEIFSFCIDSTPSSKAIEFLAFQMTQNKHNGPKSHVTFLFLPIKEPLQPIRVSLTESGKTQETPKKERSKPLSPLLVTLSKNSRIAQRYVNFWALID